jgi:predicted polyphosphate/ATP-dependent NAD kinase
LSFSLATSNGSRHAGELAAAAAADNANTIVVAGGDGTVNDVVNGLFPANATMCLGSASFHWGLRTISPRAWGFRSTYRRLADRS